MKSIIEYISNDMKSFKTSLKESLLDDEDDLLDVSDNAVKRININDPQFIQLYKTGWKIENDVAIHEYERGQTRQLPVTEFRPTEGYSIKDLIGVDTVEVRTGDYAIRTRGTANILSPNTFCKNLIINNEKTSKFVIHSDIKDMNINVRGSKKLYILPWNYSKIENTTIDFEHIGDINITTDKIPVLKNVKSNASEIKIHDTFMFDNKESIGAVDKILALPYNVKVYDSKKKEIVDIAIKSFKKIHAIINNIKRYSIKEPILRLKPGTKLSDLIDVSKFNELRYISIYNNLVQLKITPAQGNIVNDNEVITSDGWKISVLKRH